MKPAGIALLLALAAAGCGETPQAYRYQDGRYAGKPDTPAWQHPQFDNSREQWQRAIKTRNLQQSEYTRMKGSG